jgi:hypothetical protein
MWAGNPFFKRTGYYTPIRLSATGSRRHAAPDHREIIGSRECGVEMREFARAKAAGHRSGWRFADGICRLIHADIDKWVAALASLPATAK